MTTWINTTHSTLSGATKPLCIDDIAAKQYNANPTKAQTKAVERELKALHKAGLLESTPGRGGLPHYSLITPTAEPAPQPRPSAAAVAVHAALEGGTDPVPDLAEQLRQAHAERLAMSQTIIAICCAIGRDPGQTTTADLPQALRDYVDAQIVRITAPLTDAIAIIRAAIPAGEHLDAGDLAIATQKTMAAAKRDRDVLDVIRNTLAAVAADLVPDCGSITTEPEAIRIMAQLIDTQHAHLHAQALHIETQDGDLDDAARKMDYLTQQITELRDQLEAQAAQHQAETGLLADKNAKLHAEIEHLRNQPTPTAEAAERTATSALRAGAGQADIYAVKRIAIGKRHPVIKPA